MYIAIPVSVYTSIYMYYLHVHVHTMHTMIYIAIRDFSECINIRIKLPVKAIYRYHFSTCVQCGTSSCVWEQAHWASIIQHMKHYVYKVYMKRIKHGTLLSWRIPGIRLYKRISGIRLYWQKRAKCQEKRDPGPFYKCHVPSNFSFSHNVYNNTCHVICTVYCVTRNTWHVLCVIQQ